MNSINEFDYLGNLKVSMFPLTVFKNNNIYMLSGGNKYYKKGDKLNLNTLCYKYKKSCIIMDYKRKEEGFYGVIIENEILIDYKKITEYDFSKVEAVYLPTGEELLVEYYNELNEFVANENKLNGYLKELEDKYNSLLLLMQEKAETDEMYFILNKYKLDEIKNETLEIKNNFEEAWIDKNANEDIVIFGIYLSCLISEMNKNLSEIQALEILSKKRNVKNKLAEKINEGETTLGIIKDEFSNFLAFKQDLNKEYLKWLDLDKAIKEEETRDIISNIILNIHFHLES